MPKVADHLDSNVAQLAGITGETHAEGGVSIDGDNYVVQTVNEDAMLDALDVPAPMPNLKELTVEQDETIREALTVLKNANNTNEKPLKPEQVKKVDELQKGRENRDPQNPTKARNFFAELHKDAKFVPLMLKAGLDKKNPDGFKYLMKITAEAPKPASREEKKKILKTISAAELNRIKKQSAQTMYIRLDSPAGVAMSRYQLLIDPERAAVPFGGFTASQKSGNASNLKVTRARQIGPAQWELEFTETNNQKTGFKGANNSTLTAKLDLGLGGGPKMSM